MIRQQKIAHAANKDVETHEQIKLEDIERDNLTSEKIKELLETQQTQNIKTSNTEEDDNEAETSKEQTRDSVQYAEALPPSASGINYDGYLSLRYLTPGPAINYVQAKGKKATYHKHTQMHHNLILIIINLYYTIRLCAATTTTTTT